MRSSRAFFASCLLSSLALVACGGSEGGDTTTDSGTIDAPFDNGGDSAPGDTTPIDSSPGDSTGVDTNDATPRVPKQHRPSASTCAPSSGGPAGPCSSGGGTPPGSCKADSDCTAGTNGHCEISGGGALICACFYDTCANDSDCTTGGPCACQGTPYESASNACAPAGNCKVDADCGAGGFCSPSENVTGCAGGLAGYFCHTAGDECIDDADCPSTSGPKVCTYDASKSHWACKDLLLCG